MLLEMNVKLRRGHFDLTTRLSISDSSVGLFGKSGAGKSTIQLLPLLKRLQNALGLPVTLRQPALGRDSGADRPADRIGTR